MRFSDPFFLFLASALPLLFFYIRKKGFLRGSVSRRISLSLRFLTLFLVILALAGLEIAGGGERVNVLFLSDHSDSMSSAADRIPGIVSKMNSERGDTDLSAWVMFGRDVQVERSFRKDLDPGVPESLVDGGETDIPGALTAAVSLFPEEGEKRIVLLTDGRNTGEILPGTAEFLRDAGVSVYPVLLGRESAPEVAVLSVDSPETVRAGEAHEIVVTIYSSEESDAYILFRLDDTYLGEDTLDLAPGLNTWSYTSVCRGQGIHFYHVEVYPGEDEFPENNMGMAAVRVEAPPSVLLISSEEKKSSLIAGALKVQDIDVFRCTPAQMPRTTSELSRYGAILCDNVPAYSWSYETMENLEYYVRRGGGFLMIGGPDSFGVGGYFASPVETLLPVSMDVTSRIDVPPLAVIMVIDKSGSMGADTGGGVSKLDLVKEAVLGAVEVLNPFYSVGVLAFDADFEWTVPVIEAGRRDEIGNGVGTLEAGGGTRLYAALEEAFRVQSGIEAGVRHIIVLSDGLTDNADYSGLSRRIAEEGITLSSVGIGSDADRALLEDMARLGHGRAYYTDDPKEIPDIFVTESTIVSRNLIVETPFVPLVQGRSDIIKGLDIRDFPILDGYVMAYDKDRAERILTAAGGNPLLSTWRYGLGRSAAFTSDLNGRWSSALLEWNEFPVFLSQLIRWLIGPPDSLNLYAGLAYEGDALICTVDVLDDGDRYVDFLDLGGYLLFPDLSEQEVRFEQIAPGRYRVRTGIGEAGIYSLTLFDRSPADLIPVTTVVRTLSYPLEFFPQKPDIGAMMSLAGISGGQIIEPGSGVGTGIYDPSKEASHRFVPLRFLLAMTAALLFFLDLFVRYFPLFKKTSGDPITTPGSAG